MTAESIMEKIAPGIIGLIIGVYFLTHAEKILNAMISSQERFNKGVLKLDNGVDRSRLLFGKIFTYMFGFIATAVSLFVLYDGIFN